MPAWARDNTPPPWVLPPPDTLRDAVVPTGVATTYQGIATNGDE
jgi:hypothetical protein